MPVGAPGQGTPPRTDEPPDAGPLRELASKLRSLGDKLDGMSYAIFASTGQAIDTRTGGTANTGLEVDWSGDAREAMNGAAVAATSAIISARNYVDGVADVVDAAADEAQAKKDRQDKETTLSVIFAILLIPSLAFPFDLLASFLASSLARLAAWLGNIAKVAANIGRVMPKLSDFRFPPRVPVPEWLKFGSFAAVNVGFGLSFVVVPTVIYDVANGHPVHIDPLEWAFALGAAGLFTTLFPKFWAQGFPKISKPGSPKGASGGQQGTQPATRPVLNPASGGVPNGQPLSALGTSWRSTFTRLGGNHGLPLIPPKRPEFSLADTKVPPGHSSVTTAPIKGTASAGGRHGAGVATGHGTAAQPLHQPPRPPETALGNAKAPDELGVVPGKLPPQSPHLAGPTGKLPGLSGSVTPGGEHLPPLRGSRSSPDLSDGGLQERPIAPQGRLGGSVTTPGAEHLAPPPRGSTSTPNGLEGGLQERLVPPPGKVAGSVSPGGDHVPPLRGSRSSPDLLDGGLQERPIAPQGRLGGSVTAPGAEHLAPPPRGSMSMPNGLDGGLQERPIAPQGRLGGSVTTPGAEHLAPPPRGSTSTPNGLDGGLQERPIAPQGRLGGSVTTPGAEHIAPPLRRSTSMPDLLDGGLHDRPIAPGERGGSVSPQAGHGTTSAPLPRPRAPESPGEGGPVTRGRGADGFDPRVRSSSVPPQRPDDVSVDFHTRLRVELSAGERGVPEPSELASAQAQLGKMRAEFGGKVSAHAPVWLEGGKGRFNPASLGHLREQIAGREGSLVLPAGRVERPEGLAGYKSVVPTRHGVPTEAKNADTFHVHGNADAAAAFRRSLLPRRPANDGGFWGAESARGTGPTALPLDRGRPGEIGSGSSVRSRSVPTPHGVGRDVPRPVSRTDFTGTPPEARGGPESETSIFEEEDWLFSTGEGSLLTGDGHGGELVIVPAGSKGMTDGAGELSLVVLPDGRNYIRGLNGEWSARGKVGVSRIFKPPKALEETISKGIEFRDQRTQRPVAYLADDGRVFVKTIGGGWEQRAARDPRVEAWLAGASKYDEIAALMLYIDSRATSLEALTAKELESLRTGGNRAEAYAAVYEMIRRGTKPNLRMRWTQAAAVKDFLAGKHIDLASGEGKSLLFHVAAGLLAARGVGAMKLVTTGDYLASRDFDSLVRIYESAGVDVVRTNPKGTVPAPREGRPTIYVGTNENLAFSKLDESEIPGDVLLADELDAMVVWEDNQFVRSDGLGKAASRGTTENVIFARDVLKNHPDEITEGHFGLTPGQRAGTAALNEEGRLKIEGLLGGTKLSQKQIHRLNMAAAERWVYTEGRNYFVSKGGEVIPINRQTGKPMAHFDAETGRVDSATRFNDGLSQAIEAARGLRIRADATNSRSITLVDLYASHKTVVGASGTLKGLKGALEARGLSGEISVIPRYFDQEPTVPPDLMYLTPEGKFADLADLIATTKETGRPQVVIAVDNDEVALLKGLLDDPEIPAVDAELIYAWGAKADSEIQKIVDEAGNTRKVSIFNMVAARGVDFKAVEAWQAVGVKVWITQRSPVAAHMDIQAMFRASRNGYPGEAQFLVSAEDAVFHGAQAKPSVVTYREAVKADSMRATATPETAAAVEKAAAVLRAMVPILQSASAAGFGIETAPQELFSAWNQLFTAQQAFAAAVPTGPRLQPQAQPPQPQTELPDAISNLLRDGDQARPVDAGYVFARGGAELDSILDVTKKFPALENTTLVFLHSSILESSDAKRYIEGTRGVVNHTVLPYLDPSAELTPERASELAAELHDGPGAWAIIDQAKLTVRPGTGSIFLPYTYIGLQQEFHAFVDFYAFSPGQSGKALRPYGLAELEPGLNKLPAGPKDWVAQSLIVNKETLEPVTDVAQLRRDQVKDVLWIRPSDLPAGVSRPLVGADEKMIIGVPGVEVPESVANVVDRILTDRSMRPLEKATYGAGDHVWRWALQDHLAKSSFAKFTAGWLLSSPDASDGDRATVLQSLEELPVSDLARLVPASRDLADLRSWLEEHKDVRRWAFLDLRLSHPDASAETVAQVAADLGMRVEIRAAGTEWTPQRSGYWAAREGGELDLGYIGYLRPPLAVPQGSNAVFDGSGEMRLVVLPDGTSYERGPNEEWSTARHKSGEIIASRIGEPVHLELDDGQTVFLESGDEFRDQVIDQPLAYHATVRTTTHVDPSQRTLRTPVHRMLTLGSRQAPARAPDPRTFVRTTGGTWKEVKVRPAEIQAWLASANKAYAEARALYDIARRYGPGTPEGKRLDRMSRAQLGDLLLHGDTDDANAAVYELVNRVEHKQMRWTQMEAVNALMDGVLVNMAAGEGKSLAYQAYAGRRVVRGDGHALQVLTTRDNLAAREFDIYEELYKPNGFDIVRMNEDGAVPAPVEGRKTIYVGTSNDIGFSWLKDRPIPGRHVVIDEIDEALIYANTTYIISEGADRPAPISIAKEVMWARDTTDSLAAAEFGGVEGRRGNTAKLTDAARAMIEKSLDRRLTDNEVHRLNMAALARWAFAENRHYLVHEGQVLIIDQITHKVMVHRDQSTEGATRVTRWNGGLAQAIEARHGLTIRNDPLASKSVAARQIYTKENYDTIVGASGTAMYKEKLFRGWGLPGEIRVVERYYASRLEVYEDKVFLDNEEKLASIAEDVALMQQGERGARRPVLILCHENDLVARVSDELKNLGVRHTAVDARWQVKNGSKAERAFQEIIDHAGKTGQVTVVNMQGARGVDIVASMAAQKLGGLHVIGTARSALSPDVDVQLENRAARNGQPGSVQYYVSAEDDLFRLTDNEDVQLAIVEYRTAAVTGMNLSQKEAALLAHVPGLQADAAAGIGMVIPQTPPEKPPSFTASSATASEPGTISDSGWDSDDASSATELSDDDVFPPEPAGRTAPAVLAKDAGQGVEFLHGEEWTVDELDAAGARGASTYGTRLVPAVALMNDLRSLEAYAAELPDGGRYFVDPFLSPMGASRAADTANKVGLDVLFDKPNPPEWLKSIGVALSADGGPMQGGGDPAAYMVRPTITPEERASAKVAATLLMALGPTLEQVVTSHENEPDASKRAEILMSALPGSTFAVLRALGDLSRGVARIESEKDNASVFFALANAIEGRRDLATFDGRRFPEIDDDNTLDDETKATRTETKINKLKAEALGLSPKAPRYWLGLHKSAWVKHINQLIVENPDRADALRMVRVAVVTCP